MLLKCEVLLLGHLLVKNEITFRTTLYIYIYMYIYKFFLIIFFNNSKSALPRIGASSKIR